MPKKQQDRWFLPTNTENFKMMVAQGLITGADAMQKYYKDVLDKYKPYIPLFKFKNNEEAISKNVQLAISEADNMTACLLEIDRSKIQINDWRVLAPLPLTVIKQVLVETKEQQTALEKQQDQIGNFILGSIRVKEATTSEKKLFSNHPLFNQNKR